MHQSRRYSHKIQRFSHQKSTIFASEIGKDPTNSNKIQRFSVSRCTKNPFGFKTYKSSGNPWSQGFSFPTFQDAQTSFRDVPGKLKDFQQNATKIKNFHHDVRLQHAQNLTKNHLESGDRRQRRKANARNSRKIPGECVMCMCTHIRSDRSPCVLP